MRTVKPGRALRLRTVAHGTHDSEDDVRNESILISINGELVPRERAVVSVFDAGFVLGDGVWEGLRVRAGHPAFLERHLDRMDEPAPTKTKTKTKTGRKGRKSMKPLSKRWTNWKKERKFRKPLPAYPKKRIIPNRRRKSAKDWKASDRRTGN